MRCLDNAFSTSQTMTLHDPHDFDLLCWQGEYDFVYLPIDFSSRCNVGYAFINFRTPPAAQRYSPQAFRDCCNVLPKDLKGIRASAQLRFISEFHGAKTKLGSQEVGCAGSARYRERERDRERDGKQARDEAAVVPA